MSEQEQQLVKKKGKTISTICKYFVITFHIAKDMCPVSTVSNQGFKQLVNTLDKRYAMPSRYYFSRSALPALYDKCRGEVERDVASADYFATTTDLWSSRGVPNQSIARCV